MSYNNAAAPQPESFGPVALVELTDNLAEGAADALTKPRLRGWIHQYCAVVAAIAGTALVAVSWAEASKRAGHSMIFVLIAGSYTPFARLAMPRPTGYVVMEIVWAGAVAGVALTLFWPTA